MLKLLKHLKKSAIALAFVTILLFLQAYCDLSLPTYTSQIINVGIMQGGIEDQVPEVIRASELTRLMFFMSESESAEVLDHYTLIDKTNTDQNQISDYLERYPLLNTEPLYVWDKKAENTLSDTLSYPMMFLYMMENSEEAISSPNSEMDPKEMIEQIPKVVVEKSALSYIKAEYKAIGMNVNRIQTIYVLLVGAKMIGIALLAMLASILVTFYAARIAAKMGRDLRSEIFHKVLSFSNKEMDQFSTASLITRSTNDIQQVQTLIVMLIRIVIYSPIIALGGIIKVLRTNSSMTWTLGVGVAAVLLLIAFLMIITLPKFKIMQKLVDRINLVTREILTGLPVIRAFSTEKYEKERFDKANVNITKNGLFVSRVMTFMFPALMLIMNLVSILIIWIGADRINSGTMQVGDMIAFIQYTMQIIISFLMLTMVSIVLPRAAVAAKRIDEILTVSSDILDPETEGTLDSKKKGLLEFHNVYFRYPNAEEDVLSDINFVAKPGETTAIIGSTGCGKSTMINLIPRLYDITSGSILINGLDIRKIKQHTLRERIGFIPQKGVLFSGTIESNISFGKPEASDDIIKKAARIAQASEFIDTFSEGYDSPISQGGTNVSGGQKQRLSIARAIAKDPEIYIFDDSFSALDYKTDATLRKTLKEELSDSTVIIVAQRISTIISAEQILVLDEGRIVGKGTHKELLKDCEVYRQIAASQLSKEELAYE
ncbi:MAG TPA: ABC transporter ATP-binding protein [Mobilitalea sp.]|nr:ABC transporter ATP-binding protein [Mobilitalea sp.]